MRRMIIPAAMIALLISSAPAYAIVPVVDEFSIFQQIQSLLQEVKGYALQAQQYAVQARQLETEVDQYIAFVHNPTLGAAMGIMNTAGLGNSLPINPYALQSLTSGYGGLLGKVGALGNLANGTYTQNHVYSPTDGSWQSEQLIANGNAIAGTQGAAQSAYQDLRTHMPVIQALRDRLLTATNPKDVADASAQLQAEAVWTHSLNSQLAAVEANYRVQQDSRMQRENESLDAGIDSFLAQAKAAGRGL